MAAISGTVYRDYAEGVRIDEETSYASGAVETDAVSLGQVTNISATWTDNVGRQLGIGEGRNETLYNYGTIDITGSIDWNVLSQMATTVGSSIGFMQFFFGSVAGAGSTADPYLISEQDNIDYTNMFSFAIYAQNESGATDDVDLYEGCVANSLSLTAAQGDILKASMDWTANKVTCNTSITTAYSAPTESPWAFQQGEFKWGSGPSAVAGISNFTLTVNNSPFVFYSLGSRFIEKPEYGRRLYDFTLTCKMTSDIATTLRDNLFGQANSFIAGVDPSTTTADYEIELQFAEGGSTGDKVMQIALDQCTLSAMSKAIPVGQGLVEVTFTGFAKQGKSNNPIKYYTTT